MKEEDIVMILREVAKEGAVNGRPYLEAKARQIIGIVLQQQPQTIVPEVTVDEQEEE